MGLKHAARKVNDQVFMVHYNVAGSNGKSTWFGLVKKAYGELFMDCSTALLVAPAFNNPSAANEELMSIKGMCVVLWCGVVGVGWECGVVGVVWWECGVVVNRAEFED